MDLGQGMDDLQDVGEFAGDLAWARQPGFMGFLDQLLAKGDDEFGVVEPSVEHRQSLAAHDFG